MCARAKERRSSGKQFEPDSAPNWDFTGVAEAELIACCLWEYARESPTIQLWSNLHWCNVRDVVHREEYRKDPALEADHNRQAEIIFARAKGARFDYEAFSKRLWRTDYPFLEIYDAITHLIRDGATPWQQLPRKTRAFLSRIVGESAIIQPLDLAFVGELEELWKKNSVKLLEARSEVDSVDDDSAEAMSWESTTPVQPFATDTGAFRERIVAAFTVDFSRFTDREITQAFSRWLSENRPKEWTAPRRVFPGAKQKGRKLVEYRVALERLGLMRLLHWHSPSELRKEMPEAWEMIRRKEQCFRREIQGVLVFFRKLFPFVPRTERLHRAERNGIWLPPMLRICEQVERDRQRGTRNR